MTTYRIVRFFQDNKQPREVITRGLSLEQAQEHCEDPDTSSKTCTTEAGMKRTQLQGPWFDGYEEE